MAFGGSRLRGITAGTRAQQAPEPKGQPWGNNARQVSVTVNGPGLRAIGQAQTLAYAVNTFSPMSSGSRYWVGLTGYGVGTNRRLGGRVDPRFVTGTHPAAGIQNAVGAISPVVNGKNSSSVRKGMQAGPSQQPAYPGTGAQDNVLSLAWMSLSQVSPRGLG